jgi:hypothetical protein
MTNSRYKKENLYKTTPKRLKEDDLSLREISKKFFEG